MSVKSKPKRNGVFVGGYVPEPIKKWLKEKAKRENSSVQDVISQIVEDAIFAEQESKFDKKINERKSRVKS